MILKSRVVVLNLLCGAAPANLSVLLAMALAVVLCCGW